MQRRGGGIERAAGGADVVYEHEMASSQSLVRVLRGQREGARDVRLTLGEGEANLRHRGALPHEQIRSNRDAKARGTATRQQVSLIETALAVALRVERHRDDRIGTRALPQGSVQLGGKQIAQRLGHAALAAVFEREHRLANDAIIDGSNAQRMQHLRTVARGACGAGGDIGATTRQERATATRTKRGLRCGGSSEAGRAEDSADLAAVLAAWRQERVEQGMRQIGQQHTG